MNIIKKCLTDSTYFLARHMSTKLKRKIMNSYHIPAYIAPELFQKLRTSEFPTMVVIQTHAYCNASCIMCPYRDIIKDKNVPKGYMKPELFYKIIDECSKYNVKKISPYLMNGPLLDENMFNYIKYIRKKMPKAVININSNGFALTKEKAEKLAETGIHRVVFSVHGISEKKYKKITGLDLKTVLENIDYYLSLKKKNNTSVEITGITEWFTDEELKKWVDYWNKRNVKLIYRNLHSRAKNVKVPEVISKMQKFGKTKGTKDKIYGCTHREGTNKMDIMFNGDVVLCCMDWYRSVVLGNVNNDSLYNIWNSEKFNKIRRMMVSKDDSSDNFICKRCVKSIG